MEEHAVKETHGIFRYFSLSHVRKIVYGCKLELLVVLVVKAGLDEGHLPDKHVEK
jgi:hypothetical protein